MEGVWFLKCEWQGECNTLIFAGVMHVFPNDCWFSKTSSHCQRMGLGFRVPLAMTAKQAQGLCAESGDCCDAGKASERECGRG